MSPQPSPPACQGKRSRSLQTKSSGSNKNEDTKKSVPSQSGSKNEDNTTSTSPRHQEVKVAAVDEAPVVMPPKDISVDLQPPAEAPTSTDVAKIEHQHPAHQRAAARDQQVAAELQWSVADVVHCRNVAALRPAAWTAAALAMHAAIEEGGSKLEHTQVWDMMTSRVLLVLWRKEIVTALEPAAAAICKGWHAVITGTTSIAADGNYHNNTNHNNGVEMMQHDFATTGEQHRGGSGGGDLSPATAAANAQHASHAATAGALGNHLTGARKRKSRAPRSALETNGGAAAAALERQQQQEEEAAQLGGGRRRTRGRHLNPALVMAAGLSNSSLSGDSIDGGTAAAARGRGGAGGGGGGGRQKMRRLNSDMGVEVPVPGAISYGDNPLGRRPSIHPPHPESLLPVHRWGSQRKSTEVYVATNTGKKQQTMTQVNRAELRRLTRENMQLERQLGNAQRKNQDLDATVKDLRRRLNEYRAAAGGGAPGEQQWQALASEREFLIQQRDNLATVAEALCSVLAPIHPETEVMLRTVVQGLRNPSGPLDGGPMNIPNSTTARGGSMPTAASLGIPYPPGPPRSRQYQPPPPPAPPPSAMGRYSQPRPHPPPQSAVGGLGIGSSYRAGFSYTSQHGGAGGGGAGGLPSLFNTTTTPSIGQGPSPPQQQPLQQQIRNAAGYNLPTGGGGGASAAARQPPPTFSGAPQTSQTQAQPKQVGAADSGNAATGGTGTCVVPDPKGATVFGVASELSEHLKLLNATDRMAAEQQIANFMQNVQNGNLPRMPNIAGIPQSVLFKLAEVVTKPSPAV